MVASRDPSTPLRSAQDDYGLSALTLQRFNDLTNATDSGFLPADSQGLYCFRVDAKHPRHARNKVRGGLGAGGNFKLQIAPERSSVFHA